MKKILLALFAVFFLQQIHAQTEDKKWNIGVFGGATQYNGDLGQGFYNFEQAFYGHGGLSVSRFLSPHFDVSIQGTMGEIGYVEEAGNRFRADLITGALHFRLKLLKEEARIRPYFFAGAGIMVFGDEYTLPKKKTQHALPSAGAGFNIRLSDVVNLTIQETFMYSDDDLAVDGEKGNNNDSYLHHSVGLSFNLGSSKDADNDGVADKKDKCPGTPSGVMVDKEGCPIDRDGDGIADFTDACPDVKGVASAKGCPDRDGDTVADDADACPDDAGLVDLNGCPDRDGDRIIDKDDKCPDVKGLVEFAGCPDRDGDGIIDSEDLCPDVKGPAANKGCPDRDGDGVLDKDDKCPDVKGIASNKGCPEVKAEVKEVFRKALQGIQFETGKDVIRKNSYSILDQVAKIMVDNPEYKLLVNGHTDNVGKPESNMILSQKRADAVKKYLTAKGVDAGRMTATGYGDTKPVADNKTTAGKKENRRVEFVVEF
ncbi:MAG: OmpA family protein [Bacteroidia bacterium]|nr:OmpA family protein [Bacteroidia bacterium]HQU99761.1 OmpA family protein [Bacteroidia bacterium]